jgi:AcrR family transcriptional regulator
LSIDCQNSSISLPEPRQGLRARKQQRTRRALAEAALRLFAARGYEQTTIEEIAEVADVSPRTFFRYFASKEELLFSFPNRERPLFFISDERFQSLIEDAMVRPGATSDLAALCAGIQSLAPELEELREALGLLAAATASSAVLRGRANDAREELRARVARAVARRRGEREVSEASETVAAVGMTLFRLALDKWLAAPDPPALAELICAEFERLLGLTRSSG